MTIAIREEHHELERFVRKFLESHGARGSARALLEAERESLPSFWPELIELGWLGLHLQEEHGGSGYGVLESVIVACEFGRAVAPGPFVSTIATSALIARVGDDDQKARLLPGLADGSTLGAVSIGGMLHRVDGLVSGEVIVLGAGVASRLLLPVGDDLLLVDASAPHVVVDVPANVDPTRRSARVTVTDLPIDDTELFVGARVLGAAIQRVLLAAEAVGGARECVELAAEYAKVREQFGRPIGTFQAVKHHCANMFVHAELATAAVWHAALVIDDVGEDDELAGAMAATVAMPAFTHNAQLLIQVLGGIGITWEHDAQLLLRRAIALSAASDPRRAALDVCNLEASGARLSVAVDLPPEAAEIRARVRSDAVHIAAMPAGRQREELIATGYVMPHWPKPWGREASAVEQLVIDEEFAAAGVERPPFSITWWILLTLIQHGTEEQVARWVKPTLAGDLIWCQLFSEPNAGSDAAAIRTRAERVEGGWRVNGSKIWSSEAHRSQRGFATVRTDPDAKKHAGITAVVIDMSAPGVEVRPLRQLTGESGFNEVFFTDVFVSDADVVGAVDGGWAVARATLGNERVSIGRGVSEWGTDVDVLELRAAYADADRDLDHRIGQFLATEHVLAVLNLRAAQRAVAGQPPGPEGNVTKLVLSEHGHERAGIAGALSRSDAVFADGRHAATARWMLAHRGHSIAGGTSEITRNQIGERILGLPRDPLIR